MRKRDMAIGLLAIAAAAVAAVWFCRADALETAAWGLSFRQEGAAPLGPAGSDQLARYHAAYLGDTTEKVLYLTFDAGYENGCTEQILDALKAREVPAAFFLVGSYIEKNPDLVRRMVREGHIVGNHTVHHRDMDTVTEPEAFLQEVTGVEELYAAVTGEQMGKWYRPPQGVYSEKMLKTADSLGYRTIFWSLAYADWDNQNQPADQTALDKLLPRTHPGAIVLLHATSQTNARVLPRLLEQWEQMGYRFGSLEELFPENTSTP